MIKHTNEEIINALTIVRDVIIHDLDLVDYFYSGDKDTFRIAMTNILEKHGLHGYYELEQSNLEKYREMYNEEINSEYNRIILEGKDMVSKLNEYIKYIDICMINHKHSSIKKI